MKATVRHYDSFTAVPGTGNPAGIIMNGSDCSDREMQAIARAVGYNECCFLCDSGIADLRLRYYTPGHETGLCGHATIAAISAWAKEKQLAGDAIVRVETQVGILEMRYHADTQEVEMQQANARFVPFQGDIPALLASIGLSADSCDVRYPICYGWTGSWTLILPIRTLDDFSRMVSRNDLFPEILIGNSHSSVHPFCLECHDPRCSLHARHFSSPYSGTVEDPVTGTASGVLGAYWLKYIHPDVSRVDMYVEQGNEIGRAGTVHVFANRTADEIAVKISGRAVYSESFDVTV